MSLVLYYGSREAAFSPVNLGTQAVRLGAFSVTMSASMGDVGTSRIPIDDPTGTAGHASDQILGYHTLQITEDTCAVGNQVLVTGFTGPRDYESADSLITGAAVRITCDLQDCNRVTQFQLFRGAASFTRPAETVGARLTALIANAATEFVDSGLVVYPTTLMDAADYNGQTASNVLDDCAQMVGYNWFIYRIDESSSAYSLFFDDPNVSTAYSSTLRISDIFSEIDSTVNGGDGVTHTWGPLANPVLTRSPQNLASGILMPWAGGTYFGFRPATRDIYGDASITAADSNVKTLSSATARVDRLLWQSSTEEDSIVVSLNLPAAHVNDVREGQRMQAKFRNFPNYKSSFTWFRVMYRTVSQQALTDQFYTVSLTLSPQEAAEPVGAIVQAWVDYGAGGGLTIALPNPVTIGNILVAVEDRWKGNGTDPVPPNTNSGAGNTVGGTNAWTEVDIVKTATSGDRSHVGMWYKTATATENSGPIFSAFTFAAVYELSGVTASGATIVSADVPGASGDLIGSLGTPASGDVAIYVAAQYADGPDTVFSPADWTTGYAWGFNCFGCPRPFWTGTFLGDGTALEAQIGSSSVAPWCGIGMNFPHT